MRLFGGLSTDALLGVLPEPVRSLLPIGRRTQECPGGVRIELRNIGGPGSEEAARRLEERLRAVGMARAEVNGTLGSVFVGCDPATVDMEKLVAIVEEVDGDHETTDKPWARDAVEQHARAALHLGGSLIGAGVAVAGHVTQARLLPPIVPALVSLVEHAPRIRRELERRVGVPAADTLFATTRLVTHTLAIRPTALLIDSIAAAGRFVDTHAGRRAWALWEEEFASRKGAYRHVRTPVAPRSAPLPSGPVERYADAVGPGALAAYGLTTILSHSRQRGLSVLITGTPKAARLGRETFTGAVARALAGRGMVVLDRHALHRMDRVDTVVIDSATLVTKAWSIDGVVPLDSGLGVDELHARLYTLLDLTDPSRRREDDGWVAKPFSGTRLPAQVARWRAEGVRTVSVSRHGKRVALVGLVPELHPLAEAVVAAPQGSCTVLVAGGEAWLGRRLGVGQIPDGGPRLAASVRMLQAEGHGVAVVSRRSRAALRQADLGIGVGARSAGRVPWDADVIGEPDAVHLLLRCLPLARQASEQSVRVAAAGAIIGAGLAFLGPDATALRRAHLVSDCTSLAALAAGEWTGRHAGRGGPPISADRTPWHAMAARDVLARLHTSPGGLAESVAASRRTAAEQPIPTGPESLVRASVEELANPLTPVLAAGAGVSAAVGSALDAVLITGVMLVNALLGGAQRRDAGRALQRLTQITAVQVRLRRPDGAQGGVADDLVPGDVIELRAGDAVPADGRLFRAAGLEMDESTLTGESQLVAKSVTPTAAPAIADRNSMVYEGTTVAAGHGLAVVVATGTATEAGRTATLVGDGPPPSGVELRLRTLSRRILPVAIGSGVVLMAIDLLRGASLSAALAPAVSLAVAAVPEGLPFVATVAELAAAKRLSARNTLVRNPSTIEALGRVDVLCFDKTGTLTEGHISLRRVSDGLLDSDVDGLKPGLRQIVGAALRAGPRFEGGRAIPHPTDRAVVEGAERLGVTPRDGLGEWERIDELPFEPGRGYHAVLGLSEAGHLLSVKGAPEVVLTRCATVLRGEKTAPLDEDAMRELEREVDRLALQGFRVLAVAERAASSRADLDESRIDRLNFLGFLGLADPVRPTAKQSVEGLIRAGVRVIMITGDHPSTAEAIAAEVNALNGQRIMTGPGMDRLDDDALAEELREVAVFARVTPAHKARIVSVLRRSGAIVAVTGDGANDVPAIRLADVGVALGSHATPAARATADIVVTDNRIETIIDAIVEGRAMWGSVREALAILLGGNIGEIIFTLGSSLLTGRSALNARQLLLVNLLTDMLPAMAVAVRPPSAASPERLLAEGPEASLGAALTRDIYLRAITTSAAATAAWFLARMTGTRGRADTVGLVGLVAAQLLQTLTAGGRDRTVMLAALSSLAALGLIISVPGVSQFFGSRPIGPLGWGIGLGCAAAATVLGGVAERASADRSPAVH